jgi:hypothetical protein
METLRIYEIEYSVSPGGINSFEIYNDLDNDYETPYPLYETESLVDACNWAYNQGCNFTVFTLAQYNLEFNSDTPVPALTNVSAV